MNHLRSSGIARVLTLALAACGADDSASLATLGPAAATELTSNAERAPAELAWRACGQYEDRNLECAEVRVPIDYDQPEGAALPIALRRVRADPREPQRGALLFNPGGPGGPGIDAVMNILRGNLSDWIAPGYDIVGFDPRGVANSGAVGCGILPEDLYPGAAQTRPPARSIGDYVADAAETGARCEREWGPLFRKLGSNNVVRDMEEIRKALGEPVVNFLGTSYGTRLGALYAHEFPETTGRMVLDAAVQPQPSVVRSMRAKFYQTVELHELVLSRCESGEYACPPDARLLFDRAVANARQRGVEQGFAFAWSLKLAGLDGVGELMQWLAEEAADPGGEWISTRLNGPAAAAGDDVVFFSVNCTDDNFAPPTLADLERLRAEFTEASPVFAEAYVEAASGCAGWPATPDPVPLPTAFDAPALLVIGGTEDSRTPWEWSFDMAEALGNATLLTSQHFGHVAIAEGDACVLDTVRAYLVSGSLPASGAVCP